MKAKHLFAGMLAATALAIPPAGATTVLWDFGVGTAGNVGTTTTQLSVPDSIPIVASGFAGNPGTPTDLFRKELGGDETGLGLTNDPSLENEITPGNFIQLDLTHLHVPPLTSLDLSFAADSTTGTDEWALFLSNTAGSHGASPALTGTTETTEFINTTGFAFLDVSAVTGNVLLHTLDAAASKIPEPATFALLGVGLVGLGVMRRRRNRGSDWR